jgi:hypothetical protein
MGRHSRALPDRFGFALSSTGPGESQDQSKRLFRARPEFADHRFAARFDEVTEDERVVLLCRRCLWRSRVARHEVDQPSVAPLFGTVPRRSRSKVEGVSVP